MATNSQAADRFHQTETPKPNRVVENALANKKISRGDGVSCFHAVADREHDPNKGRYFEQGMR